MNDKSAIRREIAQRRREMSFEQVLQLSLQITNHVIAMPVFEKAKQIAVYLPIQNECDTQFIIERSWLMQKKLCLPRIIDGSLVFFFF